ncbi:MAG: ATP-binding protein [Pseudomonadota bacterium]
MGNEENRAKESNEFIILKGAVENTNEAFVTIDENHKVIFFNKAAEKIFSYSRNEVLGHDLDIIMTPQCSKSHRQAVARYVKEKKPKLIGHETEFVAARKNGEMFPASISFSVAEIEGKLFFTALVRDMTETKALQEQITKAERLAALGQIVAEITHEIKNPLMLIGGFAKQLTRTYQDEKDIYKLTIIVDEVQRLENLLMELRELYLPKTMIFEPLDINELLGEISFLAKGAAEEKNIHTILNRTPGIGLIEGNREKLKQVLLNLVKNGVEALAEGGNLSIQSRRSGDGMIEVTITDDGPGIPREHQEKIFVPFFTTKKRGSGLGLSVCKRIIADHRNSSLSLTSQEGKGTVAKITFPVFHPK